MAAKESTLSKLHELLAEMFIQDIEICKAEGIPMSASDKAVIVKFLKDNNISAEPDANDMQRIQEEFRDELAEARKKRAEAFLNKAQDDEGVLTGIL